ncbi:MAG: C-type lectin domain-containing protein [Clostridiales Family XIII bacterium]|jgi:hypothetical protein|nr:C-type lectin domain-containing protein [Clostridiales Family XIII bacterium]
MTKICNIKKGSKWYLSMLLFLAVLITSLLSIESTGTVFAGNNDISFNIKVNQNEQDKSTVLTLKDISIGKEGIAAVNITWPKEFTLDYDKAEAASWDVTKNPSGGSSAFIIKGDTLKTKSETLSLVKSLSFTLPSGKTVDSKARITISLDEKKISAYINDGTIHYYEFVKTEETSTEKPYYVTWLQAFNLARERSYEGLSGYLSTITSQEEQDFIYNSIAKYPGWLGGTRMLFIEKDVEQPKPIGELKGAISEKIEDYNIDAKVANTWYWACGPEAGKAFYSQATASEEAKSDYNNFNSGEPNNSGNEYCLQFALSGSDRWNDLNYDRADSTYNQGYYVEYSEPFPLTQARLDEKENTHTEKIPELNPDAGKGGSHKGGGQKGGTGGTGGSNNGGGETLGGGQIASGLELGNIAIGGEIVTQNVNKHKVFPSTTTTMKVKAGAQKKNASVAEAETLENGSTPLANGVGSVNGGRGHSLASKTASIGGVGIPLAGGSGASTWSLLDLVLAIACIILFAISALYCRGKKLIISAACALAAICLFLLTQDMSADSVLLDMWTPIMAIILGVEMVLFAKASTKEGA